MNKFQVIKRVLCLLLCLCLTLQYAPVAAFAAEGEYTINIGECVDCEVSADRLEAAAGEQVVLTITFDSDYYLDLLIEDSEGEYVDWYPGDEDNTYVFTMPESDVYVEAWCFPLVTPEFSILVDSGIENGTIEVEELVLGDTPVVITVKPDSGYALESLSVVDFYGDEQNLTDYEDGTFTFLMPYADVIVYATFKEIPHEHEFVDGTCACGSIGGSCGENAMWSYDASTKTLVIYGTGAMEDILWSVRPWKDLTSEITTVVVAEGITYISNMAFYNFVNLTNATLPDSLTSLGEGAFQQCMALEQICIPDSVEVITNHLFYYCVSLTSVTLPKNLKTIEYSAFNDCSKLANLVLPEGLETIDIYAFDGCTELGVLEIPASVKEIGSGAFDCFVTVDEDNAYYASQDGVLFDKNMTTLYYCPDSMEGTYIVPDGVKIIDVLAFASCDKLTSVVLPESLQIISTQAFCECSEMTDINIPNSVNEIGELAFDLCHKLTSVSVPCTWDGSLYSFDEAVLKRVHHFDADTSECRGCDVVCDHAGHTSDGCEICGNDSNQIHVGNTFEDNLDGTHLETCACGYEFDTAHEFVGGTCACGSVGGSCGETAMWSYDATTKTLVIYGTGAMEEILWSARPWKDLTSEITTVVVAEGITHISATAFYNFENLTNATLPDSLNSLGEGAFQQCIALEQICIPDSVEVIHFNLFMNCSSLTSITLPKNLKTIEYSAFSGCYKLASLVLPEGLETIELYAFIGCTEIGVLEIPASVKEIDPNAFDCFVTVDEDNAYYASQDGVLFDKNMTTLCCCPVSMEGTYIVPDGVQTIAEAAFESCNKLTSIVLPEGLQIISDGAFFSCRQMTDINIPNSVNQISGSAFDGCRALTSVSVPCTWDGSLYSFDEAVLKRVHSFNAATGFCECGEECAHETGVITYEDNNDGTHTKAHDCDICGYVTEISEKHIFDAEGSCACEAEAVAMVTINGVTNGFLTLDDALVAVANTVEDDNAVVKLMQNYDGDYLLIYYSGTYTIDMNDHTISAPRTQVQYCNLTILGGTIEGTLCLYDKAQVTVNGTVISNPGNIAAYVDGEGTKLILNEANIVGNVCFHSSEALIQDTTIVGDSDVVTGYYGATITIIGCDISGEGCAVSVDDSDLIISDSTVNSENDSALDISGGTAKVSDCVFTTPGNNEDIFSVYNSDGDVSIKDSVVNGGIYNVTAPAYELLDEGMAFWQNGKMLNVGDASSLVGDYTVSAACAHDTNEFTYTNNENGTHTKTHECGIEVDNAEAHFFDENHTCACGFEAYVYTIIGDKVTGYDSLSSAVYAMKSTVEADNAKIQLLNAKAAGADLYINDGYYTLDLNGIKIGYIDITLNGGNISIINGEIEGTIAILSGKQMKLEDITIYGSETPISMYSQGAYLTMNECDVNGKVYLSSGEAVITDCQICCDSDNNNALSVSEGVDVTITGSAISANKQAIDNYGNLIIEDCEIASESDDAIRAVSGSVTISDSVISCNSGQEYTFGLLVTGATVSVADSVIHGGFGVTNFNISSTLADGMAFWQDGKMLVADDTISRISGSVEVREACYHTSGDFTYSDNGNGTHTKTHECGAVIESYELHAFDEDGICVCGVVAKVCVYFGDTEIRYATLDDAFIAVRNATESDHARIQLLDNADEADFLSIDGGTFTVDLNDYLIDVVCLYVESGNVTFAGGTIDGRLCMYNDAKVTVNGTTIIDHEDDAIYVSANKENSFLTLNEANIEGTIYISSGKVLIQDTTVVDDWYGVNAYIDSDVTIIGSTITSERYGVSTYGNLTISDSTVNSEKEAALYISEGTAKVSNCEFNTPENNENIMSVYNFYGDVSIKNSVVNGSIYNCSLCAYELLDEGMAFWQNGKVNHGTSTTIFGSVEIKEACDHADAVAGNCGACGVAMAYITKEPENVAGFEGEYVYIIAEATGDDVYYEWYYRNAGDSEFYCYEGTIENIYSMELTRECDGREVFCIVYDAYGNSVTSKTITVDVYQILEILEQPQDTSAFDGTVVRTSVIAIGDGLTYQWFMKNPGNKKFYVSSVTDATYACKMNAANDGREVYCIVTDERGNSYITETVTLSMRYTVEIVTDLENVSAFDGEYVTFTVGATGDGLTYEWYCNYAGSNQFVMADEFDGDTFTVLVNEATDGLELYCVVSDQYGNSMQTETATVRMNQLVLILEQPQNTSAYDGTVIRTNVTATGDGLTYQWFVKNPGGTKFYESSVTDATYACKMNEKNNGREVYCEITDAYGNMVKTDVVTLTMIETVKIIKQPVSVTVAAGEKATVTVEAVGEGLTYQWYYKNANGSTFTPTDSFVGDTYSVTMSDARDGRQVFCVITDQYGVSVQSETVTLNQKYQLLIVKQPVDASAKNDAVVRTTVQAKGDGLTYQWYIKNPGSSKFGKSSVTSATYTCKMNAANDGRQVYCRITDAYGNEVKTDIVTLTLDGVKITKQPVSVTVEAGQKAVVTLEAEGEGLTYKWYYKDVNGTFKQTTTFSGNTYSVNMSAARDGRQIYCVITDAYGASVTSDTVTINMTK